MELEKGYYASPRWSWEVLDCAMPMTFDTYSNCAHQCVYCFSFFQRAIGKAADDYLHHRVTAVNVDRVKRMFSDPDTYGGQFTGYIKKRMVLQWGGLSDGFDWYERRFRKSLELLRFFGEIGYPVSISTKGTWFLDDPEYVEVIRKYGATQHWKYSIITMDVADAAALEAGTPPPQERFDAMRKLSDLGAVTTLRFRPFVIGVSEKHIEPLMAAAKAAGAISATTEFLCLEKRAGPNHRARYAAISKVCGFDVWEYYRRFSYSGSGLMRLSYDVKRPYIAQVKESAARHGLAMYVSDAHHKEQSAAAGCCGLPNNGPLAVYNRGQYAEAILIAKRTGEVRWGDIAKDAEWLKAVPWVKAEGYNTGESLSRNRNRYKNMFEFMREIWNKPESWSSPARYFGGALVPSDVKDEDGNLIYLYNRPFVEEGKQIATVAELRALGCAGCSNG